MNASSLAAARIHVRRHWSELALALICALWMLWHLSSVARMPAEVPGYEVEWVARALANSHGYSFSGYRRWLYEEGDPDEYFPTAWTDPVFTSLLAGGFLLAGEHATRGVLALNALAGIGCLAVLFALVRRYAGPLPALLAAAVLAFHPGWRLVSLTLNNATWASLFITLTALLLLRTIESTQRTNRVALGFVLGLTSLLSPTALLFMPVAAVLILFFAHGPALRRAGSAAWALGIACLVMAPWTIRNAAVFHEFVPVRTGAGQIAHIGTVALGETLRPDPGAPIEPAWHARSVRASVRRASGRQGRKALEAYQLRFFEVAPPPGYEAMNEAQRDAVHMQASVAYMRTHPALIGRMAIYKLGIYAERLGGYGKILAVLALVSALLGLRDRVRLTLAALIAAYSAPFAVFIMYFHRYRSPIEPLVIALVVLGAVEAVRLLRERITRGRLSPPRPAADATNANELRRPRTTATTR